MAEGFKYIYGPVPSWRVGSSLGVDLLSQDEKICSFDCIYCQLGKTDILTVNREVYIPEDFIIKEIEKLPEGLDIDYITISGRGEPTLALNLGEAIRSIRKIRKEKIAVITNSTLINRKDVQEDLSNADLVIAKLDADTEGTFLKINKPAEGIEFKTLIQGLTDFKKNFCGKFALQVMFIKENITSARKIAEITKKLNPDEVQINTPLRPCDVEPLRPDEISEIKKLFEGLNTITVYEKEKKDVKPINHGDTLKRRGKVLG